jgi:hypothetical protein
LDDDRGGFSQLALLILIFFPFVGLDGTFQNLCTGKDLITRLQKVEIDSFSGYRIYPSKGKLFVRGDSKVRI